jgi:hypothetical protein
LRHSRVDHSAQRGPSAQSGASQVHAALLMSGASSSRRADLGSVRAAVSGGKLHIASTSPTEQVWVRVARLLCTAAGAMCLIAFADSARVDRSPSVY